MVRMQICWFREAESARSEVYVLTSILEAADARRSQLVGEQYCASTVWPTLYSAPYDLHNLITRSMAIE